MKEGGQGLEISEIGWQFVANHRFGGVRVIIKGNRSANEDHCH